MIKGFKMKLYPGMEAEYEKRHNQLWPEMKDMIHEHGGKNYTIFLDRETLTLFGYIEIENEELWAKGADTAINRKWWDFMADIMETNPDNSPVSIDLKTVFHLRLNLKKRFQYKAADVFFNYSLLQLGKVPCAGAVGPARLLFLP